MKLSGKEILDDLKKARWDTALRTFGNNHSTLIGLLVDWWISGDPKHRRALDAGPTNGYSKKGVRGQCDALLCLNDEAIGVLEVEGYRYAQRAKNIGTFFNGKYKEIESIRFGILLMYSYQLFGYGEERHIPKISPKNIKEIRDVSERHPTKPIIVITLDKQYSKITAGIRALNEYYMCKPQMIQGYVYQNGKEIERIVVKDKIT